MALAMDVKLVDSILIESGHYCCSVMLSAVTKCTKHPYFIQEVSKADTKGKTSNNLVCQIGYKYFVQFPIVIW